MPRLPATLVARLPVLGRALRRIVPFLLVLACPLALALLIRQHAVNIPFLDDWMFTDFYEKNAAGTLKLDDFLAVQMEHRLVVPRLVLLAWQKLTPGNFIAQNWFTLAMLTAFAAQVAVLLRRTLGTRPLDWWPALALAGVSIFSPIHYQIVLWPMMFQVVMPLVGLGMALVALTGTRPLWLRFVTAAFGALLGMLSIASGLLTWLLAVPIIAFGGTFPRDRRRWIFLGCWLAATGVTLALYFHNLHNTTDAAFSYAAAEGENRLSQELAVMGHDPLKLVRFVLAFVGSHLGRGTSAPMMPQAATVGAVLTAAWITCAALAWRRRNDSAFFQAWLPWIVMGAYSIATACLVAIGRSWASQSGDNALTARYTIHGVPLVVSLVALGWWCWRRSGEQPLECAHRRRLGLAGAGAAFALWQVVIWSHGAAMMQTWASARLRGATHTLFFRLAGQVSLDGIVSGQPVLARRLDALGLLRPRMVRNDRLTNFKVDRHPMSRSAGDFTSLWRLDDGSYRAEGYARLGGRDRVADGVFLTVQKNNDPAGQWQIIHVAQCQQMPLFLGDSLGRDMRFIHHRGEPLECEDLSGFSTTFKLPSSFTGRTEVAAWAFDYREQRVQILGTFIVDLATGKIEGQRGGGSISRKLERRQKSRLKK